MVSRTTKIASGICCCFLVAIGITLLGLGLAGFFNYKDPCVEIISFDVGPVQLITDEEEQQDNSPNILDMIGDFLGVDIPTRLNITVNIMLEVNNTNTFKLDYEQDTTAENTISIIRDNGEILPLGDWYIGKGRLEKRQQKDIPMRVNASIDLEGSEVAKLVSSSTTFRMQGTILGTAWLPGAQGIISIDCLAKVDGLFNSQLESLACTNRNQLGGIVEEETVILVNDNDESTADLQQQVFNQVDTSCWV